MAKPDMVFHAVLRYPSVINRLLNSEPVFFFILVIGI